MNKSEWGRRGGNWEREGERGLLIDNCFIASQVRHLHSAIPADNDSGDSVDNEYPEAGEGEEEWEEDQRGLRWVFYD